MSNVNLSTGNVNHTNVPPLKAEHKGITPTIKSPEITTSKESKASQKNAMSWTQVGLRGLYGAAACGVYISGQRLLFQQSLTPKDLAIVMGTCGGKAMAMSAAIKAIRETYRKLTPEGKNQLPKDVLEAGLVDALETGVTYFQDKATAKDVDFANILKLSALKSYPNNLMDTKSYSNFLDWYASKDKYVKNPTEDEEKAFKARKQSFENFVITPLAALVTAIPATYLNNEPFTPTNFAKTVALRVASVKLWRYAMDKAKEHSGDEAIIAQKKEVTVDTSAKPTPQAVTKPTDNVAQKPTVDVNPKETAIAPTQQTVVYPLTGRTH